MATGDTILEGLGGLQFSAADNPFGLGTVALAGSLPKLIDPRGSVGTNLGIALGGTLLTALMGYQARQTAADLTSRATSVGLDILSAETPEQRKAIADAADQGFYGGEIKSKALSLVNALEGQKKINELAAQQTYANKLKELEALTSEPGKAYTEQQVTAAIDKIGAKSEADILRDRLKNQQKQQNMLLASDIKANEGWLSNEQKLELDRRTREELMKDINSDQDPETAREKILLQMKAQIDSNKMAAEQADKLQAMEFESALKEASASLKDVDVRKIAEVKNFSKAAYELGDYVEKQKNWFETQLKSKWVAADDNVYKARVLALQQAYGKAISGAAISEPEQKRIEAVVQGDWTAGPETKAKLLRAFADEKITQSMDLLSTFGQNRSSLYNMFSGALQSKKFAPMQLQMEDPTKPTRPAPASAGYDLTAGLSPTATPAAGEDLAARLAIDEERLQAKAENEIRQFGGVSAETAKAAADLMATKRALGL